MSLDLITIQVLAKLEIRKRFPNWADDLNQFKEAIRYIASKVVESSSWARTVLEKIGFFDKLDKAPSFKDVLNVCYEAWRASEGVLDLCP